MPKRSSPSEAPRAKKRMGSTYGEDLVWFLQDGETEYVPAVYHHKIRQELLEAAPTGDYDFPANGWGDEDVTSFLESQKTWGPERANYPPIVFEFKPPSQRTDPEYEPQEWFHNGCLVLDRFDRPMIRFRDIPDVVSSKFPGYAAEAILRTDSRITLSDILMRMPKTIRRKNGKEAVVLDNCLTQRTHRFRLQAGCVAWKERRGSKAIEEFLEEHLPANLKEANTTLGFRDLTPDETKGLEKANGERYPKKKKAAAPQEALEYMVGEPYNLGISTPDLEVMGPSNNHF